MDWFRKKLFGKMSEKNLPLDPSALEPTLFDDQHREEINRKARARYRAKCGLKPIKEAEK